MEENREEEEVIMKLKQELVDVTVFKRGSIVVGHYVIE
jgi:hypothetical protein